MSSFNTTTTYSRIHVSRIMSSIQHQQRLLAEASLGLFSATYEEILKSKETNRMYLKRFKDKIEERNKNKLTPNDGGSIH